MSIPSYDLFVEPLLRFLNEHPEGVETPVVYEEMARRAALTELDREQLLPSGLQPVYQNRLGWAHDRLKRVGASSCPKRGLWRITSVGQRFVAQHPARFSLEDLQTELSLVADEIPDPTLRIGALPAASRPPLSVKRDSPLREAMTLMMLRDYSQLPVLQSERTVNGVVSWRSIGQRTLVGGPCQTVGDCMDEHVDRVDQERPLFEVLDTIIEKGFVLVIDEKKCVSGIVTVSDVGEQFREMSEHYLLLGSIENQIRQLISGKFSLDALRAVRAPGDSNRSIESIFDMTFAEYVALLANEENWRRLRLSIDRPTFIGELNRVREIRNGVMHFDPTLDDADIKQLRDFARFLRTIAPSPST